MILTALVNYYEMLAERGDIAPLGYSRVKVSYGLSLGDDGELLDVIPLLTEVQAGKKTVERPREMLLPQPEVKAAGIKANFLCDTCSYLLGYDEKGKPQRTRECFETAGALHTQILAHVDTPAAKAIVRFFSTWNNTKAPEHPALATYLPMILKGSNLTFMHGLTFANEDQVILDAWNVYYRNKDVVKTGMCLAKGERTAIARLHPKIKGVRDAQSVGASLVSFNNRAYESYGHDEEQGLNAPVGEYAAFAYTTALNALIASPKHRVFLGDMTIVFWSADGNEAASEAFSLNVDANAEDTDTLLHDIFQKINRAEPLPREIRLDSPFCILGLAPNAARLSIRFFLRDTFGQFLKRLDEHYKRLEIVKPAFDRHEYLLIPHLLQELSNPNAKTKKPPDTLSGALVRDILLGGRYPTSLLTSTLMRVRAEQGSRKITRGRAAMIKAYLLMNSSNPNVREECGVSLNTQSTQCAYVLGRLFSVLEAIQENANPGINATIKDRYFNAACATPGTVFPTLLKLANHHLRKLEGGQRVYNEKQLTELMGLLEGTPFPQRMSLEDQGLFVIGYYHQTQARYTKKSTGGEEACQ